MALTVTDYTEIFIGTIISMSFTSFKIWYLSKDYQYSEIIISGVGWATNHALRKYYLAINKKNLLIGTSTNFTHK